MSDVTLKTVTVGMLKTNCYILADNGTGTGIIIDPGDEAEKISAAVREADLDVKYIINTHAHYDHIGAVLKLKDEFGAEILVHEADGPMLEDPTLNLSFNKPKIKAAGVKPDKLLNEGDIVTGENRVEGTIPPTYPGKYLPVG